MIHKNAFLALSILSTTCTLAVDLTPGGGNFVRVENGKVVEFNYADSLSNSKDRNLGDGSTSDDNIFNGQISIIDALNPNSPFSVWIDDLLNPDSDPYMQAVVNALKILLAIMLAALAPLGINNFTILILGFAPGSVQIAYELAIPNDVYVAAGMPHADVMGETVYDFIESTGNYVVDAETGEQLALLDNTVTAIEGANGEVIPSLCPACWTVISGDCVPDPSFINIRCDRQGEMVFEADECVFGDMDVSKLSLLGGCDSTNGYIEKTAAGQIIATAPLTSCSSSMEFSADNVTFGNTLLGEEISIYSDRYQVHFDCVFPLSSNTDTESSEVHSYTVSGPIDGVGMFDFDIDFFDDNTFTAAHSGAIKVGSTLYFGVELATPIPGVEFTVTDCNVYSDADFSAASTLEYGIYTNQCTNSRVNFIEHTRSDTSMATFSYTVFEFRTAASMTLHLSCSVRVCDASLSSGTVCKDDATCTRRGRGKRSAPEEGVMYYQVSKSVEFM